MQKIRIDKKTFVTKSWETEPNSISRKIKSKPPADCHTIVLLLSVSSLNFSLPTHGRRGVKGSNGGFWHWRVSGLSISNVASFFSSPKFTVLSLLHFNHRGARTALPSCCLDYSCSTSILYSNLCSSFHTPSPTLSEYS